MTKENTNENLDVVKDELDNIEAGGEDPEEDTPEEELEEDLEEDEDVDEEEEGEDEDLDPDDPMAKFKGKSAEEVIEMYKNLEKTLPSKVAKEAAKQAQALLKKSQGERPKGKGKTEDEIEAEIENLDFSKMKPKEFASKMLTWIDKRSLKKAQEIFDQQTKVRSSVGKEIKEATKDFPQLKENKAYRELVINTMEAASGRGESIPLKEACEKVNAVLNIKKEEAPKKKTKKRTGVETPHGTDAEPNDTEEDKVKKGLLGGGSKSPLGGLGV